MKRQEYESNNDFTMDEMKYIFSTLNEYDQFVIDDLAKQLQDGVPNKKTRATIYFGRISALELLMKLGIWMIENDYEGKTK